MNRLHTSSCIAALAASLLGGCYTAPVSPQLALPVPSARMLGVPGEGEAVVVIVRDSGFMGAGCYFGLEVNRRLIARMDVGESVRVKVPAGDLLLTGTQDPAGKALCAIAPDFKIQREFSIKAGDIKHFRIGVGAGGMDIMRSDF